jgi:hypothetical protein
MKSSTTPSFWRAYRTLSPEIQAEARKAYQLWKTTRVTDHFASHVKEISGRCESHATGGRWHGSMKARSTGFGLAPTKNISG